LLAVVWILAKAINLRPGTRRFSYRVSGFFQPHAGLTPSKLIQDRTAVLAATVFMTIKRTIDGVNMGSVR